MNSIVSSLRGFHADESAAAFIEYTALLGVILVVALSVLTAVGSWANGRWATLNASLP